MGNECQCKECLKLPEGISHWSDCAVHNEPAEPNGKCTCGVLIGSEDQGFKVAKATVYYDSGTSEPGKSKQLVGCPFCGAKVWVYKWSFSSNGKRCACGALMTGRYTYKDLEKPTFKPVVGQFLRVVKHEAGEDVEFKMLVVKVTRTGVIHAAEEHERDNPRKVFKFKPFGEVKSSDSMCFNGDYEIVEILEPTETWHNFSFRVGAWSNVFGYEVRAMYTPTGVETLIGNISGHLAGVTRSPSFGQVNNWLMGTEGRLYMLNKMLDKGKYTEETVLTAYGFVKEDK